MGDPAKRYATYEDLLAAPPNRIAEIIDGELVTQPRPASRHARAASALTIGVGGPFDFGTSGPGGWVILDEPELHLGRDVLVPDLAGWRRDRMPVIPDVAAFELAPDWVCEVASPSTAAYDRTAKMPIYAREGVSWIWMIDPVAQLLEAFRLDSGLWLMIGAWRDDALVSAPPFDAVPLELGRLWGVGAPPPK